MIDHIEPRPVFPARILRVVHRRQVHEQVEPHLPVVTAVAKGVEDAVGSDNRGVVAAVLVGLEHPRAEAPAQPREDGRTVHGQADVLFVVDTISHKMAPVLRRIYDQMCEPKWVVAFGVCTCTGGFYNNYATVQGIDTIIPVDVYIPGCPPRPESVIDGLLKLQDKIAAGAQRV